MNFCSLLEEHPQLDVKPLTLNWDCRHCKDGPVCSLWRKSIPRRMRHLQFISVLKKALRSIAPITGKAIFILLSWKKLKTSITVFGDRYIGISEILMSTFLLLAMLHRVFIQLENPPSISQVCKLGCYLYWRCWLLLPQNVFIWKLDCWRFIWNSCLSSSVSPVTNKCGTYQRYTSLTLRRENCWLFS